MLQYIKHTHIYTPKIPYIYPKKLYILWYIWPYWTIFDYITESPKNLDFTRKNGLFILSPTYK